MQRGFTLHRLMWALFFVVLVVGGGLWSARTWLRTFGSDDNGQSALPVFEFVTFTPSPTSVMSAGPRATMTPNAIITLTIITQTITPTGTIEPPLTPVMGSD
jgi:hypothetical protein